MTPALCVAFLPRAASIRTRTRRLADAPAESGVRARSLPPALDHPYAVHGGVSRSCWLWRLGGAHASRNGVPARVSRGQLDGAGEHAAGHVAREVRTRSAGGSRRSCSSQPEVVATAPPDRPRGVRRARPGRGGRRNRRRPARRPIAPREVLLAELRRQFATLPGTNVTIGQPISHRIDHMLSGTRANIAVKVFGDDLGTLRRLGERVRRSRQRRCRASWICRSNSKWTCRSCGSCSTDRRSRATACRPGDVAEAIETSLGRRDASAGIFDRGTAFDLTVKFDPDGEPSSSESPTLPIDTPGGAIVPIRVLADVRREQGPNMVLRENVQRRIVISCNVAGRGTSGASSTTSGARCRGPSDAGRVSAWNTAGSSRASKARRSGCWSSACCRSPAVFMLARAWRSDGRAMR